MPASATNTLRRSPSVRRASPPGTPAMIEKLKPQM
jgi:hypothetical protein